MTTAVSAEYLLSLPDFAAWCKVWEDAGRAPEQMIDWLMDHGSGYHHAAEAVRWCVGQEERDGDLDGVGGARPYRAANGYGWNNDETSVHHRSDIPKSVFLRIGSGRLPTFAHAIAALLAAWESAGTTGAGA